MSEIRNVFVSDIPFDLSEDQVRQLMMTAGRLTHFRLVFDREKQRHKGYAFVEYETTDEANKAVQTLNRMQILGRQLRVSISRDREERNRAGQGQGQGQSGGGSSQRNQYQQNDQYDRRDRPGQYNNYNNQNRMQQQNAGHQQSRKYQNQGEFQGRGGGGYQHKDQSRREMTSLVVDDEISRTLSQFPPEQIVEILSTMKTLIKDNPAQARDVLMSDPNLAYCISQALLLMGIADKNVIAEVVASHQQQAQNPNTAPAFQQQRQSPPNPASAPAAYSSSSSSGLPPPPPPPAAASAPEPPREQLEMVKQILSLTHEQIAQLSADQQAQVQAIKQQYGHMVR